MHLLHFLHFLQGFSRRRFRARGTFTNFMRGGCLWGVALALGLLASGVQAQEGLSLADAVREALAASPEVEAARREADAAGLEEPLLLSNLDPKFAAGFSYADDQSPRAAPAFQGMRSRLERWEAGVSQNTLLGTEARLRFTSERLRSPAAFRVLDPSVDSRLSLDFRQPLLRYFWGRPDVARRRRARAGAREAEAFWRAVRERVALEAARALLELGHAQRLVAIKEEGVEDAKDLLEKYREKRRYGLVEASDLLQAEASLELQQTELLLARSIEARAQNALRAALHRRSEAPARVGSLDGLPAEPGAKTQAEALDARPELAAARSRRERLEWGLRVETLDALPDLVATLSYGTAGLASDFAGAFGDARGFEHPVKAAGLSLAVPFGMRRERLLRRSATLALEAARAREREAETRVLREFGDARELLSLARRRLEAGRRIVELEARKFAAEEENFRRGRSSTDLLLRFQQDRRRAEAELLRAETDEALARSELARASGSLAEAFVP